MQMTVLNRMWFLFNIKRIHFSKSGCNTRTNAVDIFHLKPPFSDLFASYSEEKKFFKVINQHVRRKKN